MQNSDKNGDYEQDVARRSDGELIRLLQFTVETSADAIFWIMPDGRFYHVNEAACEELGYTRDELQALCVWDIDPLYTKDKWPGTWRETQRRGILKFETVHRTKSGELIPVEIISNYLKYNGAEYSCAFSRDITDRKRSEKALQESEANLAWAQSIAHVGNFSLDITEDRGQCSDEFYRILGLEPQDRFSYTQFLPYVSPEDREKLDRSIHEVWDQGKRRQAEFRIVRADGDVRFVYSDCNLIADEMGRAVLMFGILQDITERKNAEAALRQSEEKYKNLVENVNDVVWQIDEKFVFTYISPQIINVWGYTPAEVVGKTPMDFMPADEAERVSKILEDVAGKRDKLLMYENRHLRKDGRIMYLEASGQPIIDENGVYKGYRGVMRDVTERKQAEDALRESEEKFRVLADTSSAAIYVYQDENLVYVNDASERITGYSKDELIKMKFWDIIHPDYRGIVRERGLARQHGEPMPSPYEVKFITKGGETRWFELTAGRIMYMGRPAGVATFFDITERKRAEDALRDSEEKYRFLVENSKDLIWKMDPQGRWTFVSSNVEKVIGYMAEEMVGKPIWDFIAPECHGYVQEKMSMHMRVKEVPTYIIWSINKDSSRTPQEVSTTPLTDEKGNIVGVQGIARDITLRIRAEKLLKEAKAQAELYVDLMSHDINNMNQSAQGFLELALQMLEMDGKIGRDGKVLIEKPLQSIQSSSKLISNVRKLQRLSDEGVKTRPVDLHDLFEELKSLDFHVGDRDATINIQEVPHAVVEGSDLLRDVFFNLISNAVKHSGPDRPVTVEVRAERVDRDSLAYYRCTVEDNGPGIPDELKPRLFHRFQRGKTQTHGKGLGLYLVRMLVEGYHGKVWVEDRVKGDHSNGARFVVMLPAIET